MIPSQKIRALCLPAGNAVPSLISPFDSARLGSYYYNLTVECVVVPGRTPELIKLDGKRTHFVIKPGRIAWLRMAEKISTHGNIIASLEQTHHFTRRGLTFINLSLIFPNYSGYLTCAVANFSSSDISVFQHDIIARLTFFELESSTYAPHKPKVFETKMAYDAELIREATDGDDSFFGLSEIESKIRSSVLEDLDQFAKKVLWRFFFAGSVLIFFFTVLPVLQGMFTRAWDHDTIVTREELWEAIESIRMSESQAPKDKHDEQLAD
jgi:deoxycytidine triphosphate deaminase